ncbi:MAG: hypothetical protein K2I10_03655 [Lachnospiraceae bacterium]|nr:hypothetical protein [Lachnospiraceae bacterium]
MTMEISSNHSNYATSSTNTTKNVGSTKDSNVITSTVEMKTSTPGVTKTEQIKTGYKNVNDYSQYLQEKYRYMNTGTTSMQGVPTTVSVSSAFLKKCMNDAEKAKYLEENLAAIPDCVKSLCNSVKMAPGSPVVTYATYKIDDNGNISMMSGSTNDPDGKIAKENAERKAKEKKAQEEKAAKRRAKEEKAAERRAEKKAAGKARTEMGEYTVSATGTDIKAVTQKVIADSSGTSAPIGASFDIKA